MSREPQPGDGDFLDWHFETWPVVGKAARRRTGVNYTMHLGQDEQGYFADVEGRLIAKDKDAARFADKVAKWVKQQAAKHEREGD